MMVFSIPDCALRIGKLIWFCESRVYFMTNDWVLCAWEEIAVFAAAGADENFAVVLV